MLYAIGCRGAICHRQPPALQICDNDIRTVVSDGVVRNQIVGEQMDLTVQSTNRDSTSNVSWGRSVAGARGLVERSNLSSPASGYCLRVTMTPFLAKITSLRKCPTPEGVISGLQSTDCNGRAFYALVRYQVNTLQDFMTKLMFTLAHPQHSASCAPRSGTTYTKPPQLLHVNCFISALNAETTGSKTRHA